jgi:demethylmenaquinone methyltransferase / 2-methoxy-6-polyprenyl-1,4-benzoquinol methylase
VLGFDFAYPMLDRPGQAAWPAILPAAPMRCQLPLPDGVRGRAMVAFGVRNLAAGGGAGELARVVRPGGRVVILEFMTPAWQPFRWLYLFYFRRILPLVGRAMVSRHGSAYAYLPASVLEFPEPPSWRG